jgi:isopentenyl-diphosphate delta-isomerase
MAPDLKEYDEEQVRLMEEMCIVVDENDVRIGADSKKTCKCLINNRQIDSKKCQCRSSYE